MSSMDEKLIIIGTGPAGYTAAIYAARADLSPLVFTGEQLGGQLTTTTEIENFPGFPEGIMGPDLMFNMSQQAEKFGARYAYENVISVSREECSGLFVVTTSGGAYKAGAVIVATGATARYLGIEGEKELIGHGLTACATCDGAFYRDVPVCVVGGGDSACEEASFLTRFASKVYLIHRRDQLRASKAMQQRVLSNPKIEPVWNSTIAAYSKDDAGELSSVTLRDTVTGEQRPLEVKCVFMAIGHKPNSKFLGDLVDVDDAGFIIRTNGGTATKTPGLFAAGDVADPEYRQAVSAAGMGCWAAIEAERYLLAQE
ncbi:MAG: thioredoxin-disulfide reductase [Akkermansia sp.]|nr:thioredoxin-disulfide reductase [Akkermansia sp.]